MDNPSFKVTASEDIPPHTNSDTIDTITRTITHSESIESSDSSENVITLRPEELDKITRTNTSSTVIMVKQESTGDDTKYVKNFYASKKNIAEGMMDIALLTANASQLRFLLTYNTGSQTFYLSVSLVIISLILQVAVGVALIFKRQMKNRGKREKIDITNDILVVGIFLVTVINVFAATLTVTEQPNNIPKPDVTTPISIKPDT